MFSLAEFVFLRPADAVKTVVSCKSARRSGGLYSLLMMEASRHRRNDNVAHVPGHKPVCKHDSSYCFQACHLKFRFLSDAAFHLKFEKIRKKR